MPDVFEKFLANPPSYEELDALFASAGAWAPMCVKDDNTPVASGKEGSFLALPDENGGMPILRCPSFFDALDMPPWLQDMFVRPLKERFNFDCNIIKVQKYVNGQSGIAKHTDKGLDLAADSPIFFFRINKEAGSIRSVVFEFKENDGAPVLRYPLKSNDLLLITAQENQQTVHYVPVTEDETDSIPATECISLVFRNSGTYRMPVTGQIYGIGAKYPTWEARREAVEGADAVDIRNDTFQRETLHKLYRFENTKDLSKIDTYALFEEIRQRTY